jgi:transposase
MRQAVEKLAPYATPSNRPAPIFYLPPYSPDMNPIELAFTKLEALLRQNPARTIDALWRRLGTLLDAFNPADAPTSSATPAINTQCENALVS